MKFSEEHENQAFVITGYDLQSIHINNKPFNRGFILSSDSFNPDWSPQSYTDLKVSHLDEIFALRPELILLGTGEKQIFPSKDIYLALIDSNIGFEVMNTQAACRTFNILTADDRNVAAALFLY
jgi:uncharacterized protein